MLEGKYKKTPNVDSMAAAARVLSKTDSPRSLGASDVADVIFARELRDSVPQLRRLRTLNGSFSMGISLA